jgi:hypothetical protein
VQSQAQAPVNGTGTAIAWAAIGNGADTAPVMVTDQAVALLTAEPTTADVNNVLSNNFNINTAFTAGSPTYFGIGELGGAYAYSSNDTASETETSAVHMTVDLTKVSPLNDLIIGFYSGAAAGTGFTSMSLDVKINGTDNITNFATDWILNEIWGARRCTPSMAAKLANRGIPRRSSPQIFKKGCSQKKYRGRGQKKIRGRSAFPGPCRKRCKSPASDT